MKQKLISRLIVGALATIAASSSFAGQIQSSSISIAREVITSDTQAVNSPSISYRFAGDVNATVQAQTFQVQFTLGGGAEWDTLPSANNIAITPQAGGESGNRKEGGTGAGADFTVDAIAKSADNKTLYVTITVPQAAANNWGQPLVAIAEATGTKPTIKNLYTVVGAIGECDLSTKKLEVSVKHFNALSNPSALADGVSNGVADEHVRSGATNTGTVITFPTNLAVVVGPTTGNARLTASDGGLTFSGVASGTVVAGTTQANYGNLTPRTSGSFLDAAHVALGYVELKQYGLGYDAGLATQYLAVNSTGVATAVANAGAPELANFTITVRASDGFVPGGKLYAVKAPALAGTLNAAAAVEGSAVSDVQTITAANATSPITLTVPTAAIADNMGTAGGVALIYQTPGGVTIPASAFEVTEARAKKAPGAVGVTEQDNYCKGNLYSLAGGIKIDVRNYASSAREDGWMSVIRVINPSETRTVDFYGQYILADGKYGKWGKLGTLAPRAVVQLTPDQVAAALTSAPAHATAANNDATGNPATAGDAPRLRITSNADTLRVQNYLYNPASQNFIEASGSQGVDFTGNTERAPQYEGQYTEQDAQAGLNGGF